MRNKILLAAILCLLCVHGYSYTIVPGNTSLCVGATVTESVLGPPGHWTSSNAGVATVGIISGVVTGISAGTAVITFAGDKNYSTAIVTVNMCCLTSSLIINTGYDPIAMTANRGTSGDNGVPVSDPKWIVSGISSDARAQMLAFGSTPVAVGGKADIIDSDLSPTYPAASWITNTTASPSSWITAQNAHGYGTNEDNTLDLWMILTRPFGMCLDDSVRIDVMIADDNYIVSANIDDTVDLPEFAVQAATGTNPDEHANHQEFHHFVTGAGVYLGTGAHKLNIIVQNYNFPESTIYNPTGMNLYGTLYSVTGHSSLVREDDSTCRYYSCGSESHTTSAPLVSEITGDMVCFPNPNNGSFTLRGAIAEPGTSKEASIEVMDMMGKVVYRDIATISNGSIDKTISLGEPFADGVYLIKVISENSNKVIRVSVQR